MIKHVFIVRWVREGRYVKPELDSHASAEWPLREGASAREARALLSLVDGEPKALGKEVDALLAAANWMRLRVRYNNDIDGLFVLNTDEEITREQMAKFIEMIDDYTLNAMRYERKKVNSCLPEEEEVNVQTD